MKREGGRIQGEAGTGTGFFSVGSADADASSGGEVEAGGLPMEVIIRRTQIGTGLSG